MRQSHLDKIDFRLEDTEGDLLDAYEYLIAQFASGAGKKAGEFYTPQEVSKIPAKLVTVGKDKLKTVYDPTCGPKVRHQAGRQPRTSAASRLAS